MPRFALIVLGLLASASLAACSSGSSNTVPVTPAPITIAGEYSGPVTDSVVGAETGDIVLAQHGANVGGAMTLTAGQTTTVESVTLALSGSSLTGTGVLDVNGSACTFTISGSYTTNAITATYTGVSGCTRTGTWSLSQTCIGTPESTDRRTEGVLPRC